MRHHRLKQIGLRGYPIIASLIAGLALVACSPSGQPAPASFGSVREALFLDNDFETDAINLPVATPPWTVESYLNPTPNGYTVQPVQTLASLNLTAGGILATVGVGGATGTQPDPDLGAAESFRFPLFGQRSAVVNWNNAPARGNPNAATFGNNRNVNSLRQTMVVKMTEVDPADGQVHIRFAIAPILENPNHPTNQQPYFYLQLKNTVTNAILYEDFNFSNQPGVPWQTTAAVLANGNSVATFTNWQLVDIAPGPANISLGDSVELQIIAAGCSLGAHFGRVYVDGFGGGVVGAAVPGLFVTATGPQAALANTNITYTLHYVNGGVANAAGVTVSMVMPPNTTFTSVSIPGCTGVVAGGVGTLNCPIGALASGIDGTFQVTVHINAGATGSIVNGNYYIAATGVPALLGPKVVTVIATQLADVSVTKTDGQTNVGWGQPLTYTIVAKNAGPAAAPAVTVSDPIPAQLTGATWTCVGAGGGTCAAMGSGAINDTASLPANATVTYTLTANVVAGAGMGSVKNIVNVAVGGPQFDPNTLNNSASQTNAIVPLRTLTVTDTGGGTGKVTSNPGAIDCGATCMGTYLDGTSVVLTATAAPGTTFAGWGGACASAGIASTCTVAMTADNMVSALFILPPVVSLPADMSATPNARPPISGTAAPNSTVNVSIDGMVVGMATADARGNWTFTPTTPLASGSHKVNATATVGVGLNAVTTGVGNTNTFTVGCLVNTDCPPATPMCLVAANTCVRCLVDMDCPMGATCSAGNQCVAAVPVVTTPADGSITNNMRPPITGTAPPNSTVNVSVDGKAIGTAMTDAMGNWTFNPPANLGVGPHTVNATDTLGSGPLAVTSAVSNTNAFTVIIGCLTNADCPAPAAAFCNVGTHMCVGCNGDNGSGALFECPTGALPLCTATGECRRCSKNSDCAGNPAGPVCNLPTGLCGKLCFADSDCSAKDFCNFATTTCVLKIVNGEPVPTDPPHNPNVVTGTCNQKAGAITCASGVCSLTDNRCGLPNGTPAVDQNGTPTKDPSVCRSNFINADGKCGQLNSDPVAGTINTCVDPNPAPAVMVECRSGVCFSMTGVANPADNQCGLPNGEPCTDNGACRTVCVAADDHCGLLNGTPCTNAAQCRSEICNADGKCGDPNGTPCANATTCRSYICDAVTKKCGPHCASDADCAASAYCEATSKLCVDDEPNGGKTGPPGDKKHDCDRAGECQSAVCNADGKCGDPDGTPCAAVKTCRSGKCTALKCGMTCAVDADCGAGNYCEDTQKQCIPAEPNGSPTGPVGMKTVNCDPARAAAECQSAVCNADGKCGDPDGKGCKSPATCRSAACVRGTCGAGCKPGGAGGDTECAPPFFCSGMAGDAAGMCKPDAPNGGMPDGKNCDRPSQCISNVCFTDGACGLPDGQVCVAEIQCRSKICLGGICGATTGCTNDTQCTVDKYCSAGTCVPRKPNSMPCGAAHECQSAFCHPDGKCGVPTGDPCGNSLLCRSNLCDPLALRCVDCATDANCGSAKSGMVCDDTAHTCVPGCRGMGGNGCPDPGFCTSPDATIGKCVPCTKDDHCGGPSGAKICEQNMCKDGCRGAGGNGCPAGDTCSSTTAAPGVCTSLNDMTVPPDMAVTIVVFGGGLGGGCDVSGKRESSGLPLGLLAIAAIALASLRRRRGSLRSSAQRPAVGQHSGG